MQRTHTLAILAAVGLLIPGSLQAQRTATVAKTTTVLAPELTSVRINGGSSELGSPLPQAIPNGEDIQVEDARPLLLEPGPEPIPPPLPGVSDFE